MKIILLLSLIFTESLYAQSLKVNSLLFTKDQIIQLTKEKIKIIDPTYKGKVQFKVLPFEKLVKVSKEESVKFKALDGFTSIIPGSLFHGKSKAYLAVEDKTWPKIRKGVSAGPYYLVWTHAKEGKIKQEQWPFQISEISNVENVETHYKKIYPDSLTQSAKKGFKVFSQNCLVCHKLNGLGEGVMGPDLNIPMNPTEYLQLAALKKLIRNPRSVRKWKAMAMPNFDKEAISESELQNLIQYLIEIKELKRNIPI